MRYGYDAFVLILLAFILMLSVPTLSSVGDDVSEPLELNQSGAFSNETNESVEDVPRLQQNFEFILMMFVLLMVIIFSWGWLVIGADEIF